MFREDACLSLVKNVSTRMHAVNEETIKGLVKVLSLTPDLPLERIVNAVHEEIEDLTVRAHAAVAELRPTEATAGMHRWASQLLRPNESYFPRAELSAFVAEAGARPELAGDESAAALLEVLRAYIGKHAALERRVGYMMKPTSFEEAQRLNPLTDNDQIAHFLGYEFRSEMKLFATLYELRAAVIPHLTTMFLSTGEFSLRSVRRIIDTVGLFNTMTEWGLDSKRGRACIERVNGIHGRLYIHNDAFRFVLSGILFTPEEWNRKLGWRPFTEVERMGWFHHFIKLGRAMNIQGLTDSYEEQHEWYKDYLCAYSRYNPLNRRLFDTILLQVAASFPEQVRGPIVTALLSGLDDWYRTALKYPTPPPEVVTGVKGVLFTVGHLGAALPRIPWMRSLHGNPIHPYGIRTNTLGVPARSQFLPSLYPFAPAQGPAVCPAFQPEINANAGYPEGMKPVLRSTEAVRAHLPTFTWEEVARQAASGKVWVVIDGGVYDLTTFLESHPGGQGILREYIGRDATEAFARAGHSDPARVLMLNFRVGTLEGAEFKMAPLVDESEPQSRGVPAPKSARLPEFMKLLGLVLGAVKAYETSHGAEANE